MEVLMSKTKTAIAGFMLVLFATLSHSVIAQEEPRVDFDCGKCDGGATLDVGHKFVARHSGKCLDVSSNRLDELAPLIQYQCHGNLNQLFALQGVRNNYYEIVAQNSRKCLDVLNGSYADLAPIVQFSCHGGDNQLFRFVDNGNKGSLIVAKHSSKCLDVSRGSVENGAAVVQFSCHRGGNQTWTLTR
jgi:hypothetical protein